MGAAAWFLVGLGCVLLYCQKKRKYDRTNEYGAERTPTYFGLLLARAWDIAIAFTGYCLVTMGIISIAMDNLDNWFVLMMTLPVFLWMLAVA